MRMGGPSTLGFGLAPAHWREHRAVACLQSLELLDQEGEIGDVLRRHLVDPPGIDRDALDGVQHGRSHGDSV